ncbi:hypothetical protein NY2A_b658L [Paramecium bursaria Chlorella virus NY2A]|uniref:Uncharacterized protein b658L n=1 Tax=Paramecium bursaria Chlorella virus NY2A TaxID=46021 RepID=A7IXI3_PBCVN|nr:hypothetical protein NY2A_b658L [Paramecium bursaria Chlorella virus NY2A]ABT15057.1 hypothetical protein NY2A_b658L [Paramecium bursaria Chlorella virus NY2A]
MSAFSYFFSIVLTILTLILTSFFFIFLPILTFIFFTWSTRFREFVVRFLACYALHLYVPYMSYLN